MVQKVAERLSVHGWASPFDDWKTNFANPAINWYLFQIREHKAAKGEGKTLPFTCCTQDTVGLKPSGLLGYRKSYIYMIFFFHRKKGLTFDLKKIVTQGDDFECNVRPYFPRIQK